MKTMKQTLPAGLIDGNIEYFTKDNEVFILQHGMVMPFHKSREGRSWIQKDMERNIELVTLLSKRGLTGFDLEKKWTICRFGVFDNIPDIDITNDTVIIEYHECSERLTCPLSGKICKLPAGLSHREIETIKAIAFGEPSKTAAERIGVSYHTFRAYLKNVHYKIQAHSRADVLNFAYKNNII